LSDLGDFDAGTYAGTAGTSQGSGGQDALEYLQSVYRNPLEPTSVRMRAATQALPFEKPILKASITFDGGDFADRLARATERSGRVMEMIDHQPTKIIEQSSMPDRRLRRV